MDKILAFSILSSSPADIAAGGYSTTRLSWRASGAKPRPQPQKAPEQERQGAPPAAAERKPAARFAPEFDGINCFESIVCSF
ncbi:hypothetical protein ACP4OV_017181 [Aristida adscensionis]